MNFQECSQIICAVKSFNLLKKEWKLSLLSCIIDGFFIFMLGIISGFLYDPIKQKLEVIITISFPKIQQGYALMKIIFLEEVFPHTKDLAWLLLALIFAFYIVYVLFQGANWWIAHKISGEKYNLRRYLICFAKVNILWLALFIVYNVLDVINSLRNQFLAKTIQEANLWSNIVLSVVLIIIIYAALLSYAKQEFKQKFNGLLRLNNISTFAVIAAILLILQFILINLEKINQTAGLIIGAILLFPIITWTRIYIIISKQN